MGNALSDFLTDGRVHVFDGAMGTVLYGKGVFVKRSDAHPPGGRSGRVVRIETWNAYLFTGQVSNA